MKSSVEIREEQIEKINSPENLRKQLLEASSKILKQDAKIKELMIDNDTLKKKLEKTEIDKDESIKRIKQSAVMLKPDNEIVIRKILELRARGRSYSEIYNYCNNNAIDGVTMDLIEHIIKSIHTELSPELEAYFREQMKIYTEKLTINKDYYRQMSIEDNLAMRELLFKSLEELPNEDIAMKQKIMQDIIKNNSDLSKIVKDIGEEEIGNKQVGADVISIIKDIKDRGDKTFEFNPAPSDIELV